MCLLFYFIVGFTGCRFLFGVFLCYKDVLIWWTLSTGSYIIWDFKDLVLLRRKEYI